MDPTTTLWIVSILAAGGFTATGYFLAKLRTEEARPARSSEGIEAPKEQPVRGPSEAPTPIVRPVEAQDEEESDSDSESSPPPPITLPQFSAGTPIVTPDPAAVTGPPPPITVTPPARIESDLAKTKPPPPPRGHDDRVEPEGAPHLVDQDYSALERDLRTEINARREAEKRAADLMSRLVSSSQQIAALRAKLGMADDVVRRPTSVPPARASKRPGESGGHRIQSLAPGLFSEIEDLRREVERLRSENETLRVAAFMKEKR